MKATRRVYGRALPTRHEAWIDRRSPRTAELIRTTRHREVWAQPSQPVRSSNDNAAEADATGAAD